MRYLYALLFSLVLCCGAQAQTPDELQATVSYLASDELRGRDNNSEGIRKAQNYIVKELYIAGIPYKYQKVPMANCRNLVAWVKGSSDEYIVVGAHLDHIGAFRNRIYNGADDNASGSAAILELAKRLSDVKPIRSIVFVWFTSEEDGYYGSKYFVKNPILPCGDSCKTCKKLPVFMLNLDMVGHLNKKLPRVIQWKEIDPLLLPLFERYEFAKRITYNNNFVSSDHVPFYNAGIPCVALHTGLTKEYHAVTDDADTLDYSGMVKVCHYAYDLILSVAGIQPPNYELMKR